MIELLLLMFLVIAIFLFIYNYFLYPLGIIFLAKRHHDPHVELIESANELSIFPSVTFIVAAYNEETVIAQKIENTLNIDYPHEKFEIIVVSDGSDDETPKIVKGYSSRVKGLHESARGGKSAALNRAVEVATGEIIVFSDANNDFSEDSIKQLVRHFQDQEVGAVTGAKHIYANDSRESAQGDGLYWKYEAAIKRAESKLGSITAAEGEILAVRRSCYSPIDAFKVNDDAAITFDIVKSDMRVLYEENAKSFEQASIDLIDDINVKVRMTFGGFQTIALESDYLIPPRSWFAFTFISHKVLRWLVPELLVIIFITSLMLWKIPFIGLLLVLQILFYSIAWYGWKNRKSSLPTYVYIPMYFSVMNYALLIGLKKYLNNSSKIEWKKAKR